MTGGVEQGLLWCGGAALALLGAILLWRPLVGVLRLLARTGVGVAALAALSPLGGLLGISLGVNLFNGAVLGVLGAPGLGLLLMLNWAL